MREEVEKHLAQYDKIRKIHNDLLKGKTAIRVRFSSSGGTYFLLQEGDLLMLQGISRRVHFVQTPVLLFPHWRRKIAEVSLFHFFHMNIIRFVLLPLFPSQELLLPLPVLSDF